MFASAERLPGMRSFLCADFLDFAASQLWRSAELRDLPACDAGRCPGLGHVQLLADAVAARTDQSAAQLLRGFGSALFTPLVRRYPAFVVGLHATVDLVACFDAHVAAEVDKLAPGICLPHVSVVARNGPLVEIAYHSRDGLADLAEGLLCGSVRHFAEPLVVEARAVARGSGGAMTFLLRPRTRPDPPGSRPRRTGSVAQ